MKSVNFFLSFYLVVLSFGHTIYGKCNPEWDRELYPLFASNIKRREKLVTFIEVIGKAAFSFNTPIEDFNKNSSKITENLNVWNNFQNCIVMRWIEELPKEIKKIYNSTDPNGWGPQRLAIINKSLEILQSSNNFFFKPTIDKNDLLRIKVLLQQSVDKLSSLFLQLYYSLRDMNTKSLERDIYPQLPQTIIADYKRKTGIPFDPEKFLKEYNVVKSKLEKNNKKITPEETFGILVGFTGIIPKVIAIPPNNEEAAQEAITTFINMLQELIFQSQQINKKTRFWQKKPNGTLTSSQIKDSESIINNLYSLYPATMTPFFIEVLSNVRSEDTLQQIYLLLLAEARMALIVTRAYLKAINKKI